MQTKAAVYHVLRRDGISKYRMSQDMGCAPISVNQWLSGTKMCAAYREKFKELYGVTINDAVPTPGRVS